MSVGSYKCQKQGKGRPPMQGAAKSGQLTGLGSPAAPQTQEQWLAPLPFGIGMERML